MAKKQTQLLDQPIESLRNLGAKSGQRLRQVGIHSIADLQQVGPVLAYRLVKQHQPSTALNLLWALAAGLNDQDWRQLSQATKEQLLHEAGETNATFEWQGLCFAEKLEEPMDDRPAYQHTQRSPLCLLIYALALALLTLGVVLRNEPMSWLFPLVGLCTAILAAGFHYLAVEDRGDHLAIRFGPLPLFRRRVLYKDVVGAEIGRTSILDGWGIHLSLRGGWVWNIWGRDCVVLRLRGGRLTIGTDDAAPLVAFIQTHLAGQPSGLENIFSEIPTHLEHELVDVLLQHPRLRIQRIVSCGQSSPHGFWYDQTENEWVVVLQGAAGLRCEPNSPLLHLKAGEHVLIPAHQKHRVEWTSASEPTVWLAVFFE